MASNIAHQKVSVKADSVDASVIQPSDWNAEHIFSPAIQGLLCDPSGTNDFVGIASSIAGQFLSPKRNTLTPEYEFITSNVVNCRHYEFSMTPAVPIVSGVPISVTLSPMPEGITALFSGGFHYVLINGVEHLITAVTATTVQFTPSLSAASGAWTIKSATYGIQEAHYATLVMAGTTENSSGYLQPMLTMPSGYFIVSTIFLNKKDPNNESKFGFNGSGMWATQLVARSQTMDMFKWIGSWNVSYKSYLNFSNFSMRKMQGQAYQTAGTMIYFDGHGYLTVHDCSFDHPYNGIYNPGVSVFNKISRLVAFGVVNYLINLEGYQTAPYYPNTFQISDIYADGRYKGNAADPVNEGLAESIIRVKGATGGGIAENLWLQAAKIHVELVSRSSRGLYEIQIANSIFDQDSLGNSIASVKVWNEDSTYTSSGNSPRFDNCFLNSVGRGIWVKFAEQVTIRNSHIRTFGAYAPVEIESANYVDIFGNRLVNTNQSFALQPAYVHIINTVVGAGKRISIRDNETRSDGPVLPYFMKYACSQGEKAIIKDNICFDCTNFLDATGYPGADIYIRGNHFPNNPTPISMAATITLPFYDDDTLVAFNATGIPCTNILGGYVNRRMKCVSGGALTFNTGGNIAIAKTIALNEIFELHYYAADGYWRIFKSN